MGLNVRGRVAGAIVAGIVATGMLWLYAEQLDDEHEALVADKVEVIKAAVNMPRGTPLTKDRVTYEKVPRKFLPPNPLLESELNIYLGSPVAVNVDEGAMILTSDFSVAEVTRMPQSFLTSPLVIKTAKLHIESDGPVTVSSDALEAVATAGGYIVESDLHVTRDAASFSMKARVPAAKFEKFVTEVSAMGDPVERRIRGAGVSADVARLEKKIGNVDFTIEGLKASTKKSRRKKTTTHGVEIVSGDAREVVRKTTTIKTEQTQPDTAAEIAAAEREMSELEDELSELHAQTALATVDLHVTQKQPTTHPVEPAVAPTFFEELAADFQDSGRALLRSSVTVLKLVATALPWMFVASPLILGFVVHRRSRRDQHDAEPGA